MFVNVLSDNHVGYTNVITLQLLTHLYNTYANIIDGGLEDNKDVMVAPYNVKLSIETLYESIEESAQYAAAANTRFTKSQVVSTAFCVIQKTGMFANDSKAWKWRSAVENT